MTIINDWALLITIDHYWSPLIIIDNWFTTQGQPGTGPGDSQPGDGGGGAARQTVRETPRPGQCGQSSNGNNSNLSNLTPQSPLSNFSIIALITFQNINKLFLDLGEEEDRVVVVKVDQKKTRENVVDEILNKMDQ